MYPCKQLFFGFLLNATFQRLVATLENTIASTSNLLLLIKIEVDTTAVLLIGVQIVIVESAADVSLAMQGK